MSHFKHTPTGRALATDLVHGETVDASGYASLGTPEYRGSSLFFPDTASQRAPVDALGLDYSYGLHGNPTRYTLCQRLAHIEGADYAMVCGSGLAAITLVAYGCLKQGDHWLIPDNVYNPVHDIALQMKERMGVDYTVYNMMDVADLESKIRPNTRLLWTESPGSLTYEVPDLRALVAVAKKHGVLTGIDNTWSAGIGLKPFELGLDYSIQALTKYQAGHADVLMGAVLCKSRELFEQVHHINRVWGFSVSPSDCSLVLRSLLTLPARYAHQSRQALNIAKALAGFDVIERVLHPALPSCPGHAFYQRDFTACASVFTVVLKPHYTDAQACAIVDGLNLFRIAYSWGGPESLALVVNLPRARRERLDRTLYPDEPSRQCGPLLRFAIGQEDEQDLLADLQQAFDKALNA